MKTRLINFSINRPKTVVSLMLSITIVIASAAILPSIFPEKFSALNTVKVDTDPENMLPEDEPARVFHDQMKKQMNLHELIGVGIVNTKHKDGIYNINTLKKIHELTEFAKGLVWENEKGEQVGVISVDMMSPSTVENIEQYGTGTVRFDWLMKEVPNTPQEMEKLKKKIARLNHVKGVLFSESSKAVAITLPISSKDVSYQIYTQLREKIQSLEGNGDSFHVAGLPVAEDVFGVEMFLQMTIAAPAAMLVIFLLMYTFFRRVVFVVSPLIVALVTVIISMGLLVITGNTIHIMSSMIPIFIMPIAVLDAVHILSDFFEVYPHKNNRKEAITHVMKHLFLPMLYTSITTSVGFASLVLTPIPPVQVFGVFVALGVIMAWLWTILFIPAYIMLLPDKTLEHFGQKVSSHNQVSFMDKFLMACRGLSIRHAKKVVAVSFFLIGLSLWGLTKIVINDNPTQWFEADHPIRIADREMNQHLSGTYDTYFALSAANTLIDKEKIKQDLLSAYPVLDQSFFAEFHKLKGREWISALEHKVDEMLFEKNESLYADLLESISLIKSRAELFKTPEALQYLESLQAVLDTMEVVGKTLSVVNLQKIVNREMNNGEGQFHVLPASRNAAAQNYVTFQSGHRPQDLWHFVTPDYDVANVWVMLRSGNNIDMVKVKQRSQQFMKDNPPPFAMEGRWFGLTYINFIWQDKMVKGMLHAFLGSFIIVLIIMITLFRSFWWGLLSMIPLSLTILMIYGFIGFIGKEYDMPIAVLSSLSLGLAVDYAIHFLARSRAIYQATRDWEKATKIVFQEPAKAIVRNVFVVGLGFTPLLFSPLVPYQTVGFFIAFILILAGLVSIVLLPSMITLLEKRILKGLIK